MRILPYREVSCQLFVCLEVHRRKDKCLIFPIFSKPRVLRWHSLKVIREILFLFCFSFFNVNMIDAFQFNLLMILKLSPFWPVETNSSWLPSPFDNMFFFFPFVFSILSGVTQCHRLVLPSSYSRVRSTTFSREPWFLWVFKRHGIETKNVYCYWIHRFWIFSVDRTREYVCYTCVRLCLCVLYIKVKPIINSYGYLEVKFKYTRFYFISFISVFFPSPQVSVIP